MAVQSGVLRHTDGFTVVLAEDRTFGIRDRRYLQDFLHFFFVHPGCRAVDTGFASGKAAGVMLLPVKLIVKLHIGEDGAGNQQDHQDAFDSIPAESRRKTDQWIPAYRLHRTFTGNAAAVHPRSVVAKILPDECHLVWVTQHLIISALILDGLLEANQPCEISVQM